MRERDLIASIVREGRRTAQDGSVLVGVGDDCAVLAPAPGLYLAVTTDTLVESVHFSLEYFRPWHLGRKTADVNLSDMAAMGARPRWALLDLAVRSGLGEGFWRGFSAGLLSRLDEFGVHLVGGDTVSAPDRLTVTLTLIGEVASGGWMRRDAAREGDLIFCSGYLGEAAAGLRCLRERALQAAQGRRLPRAAWARLVRRHLDPEPRVALGRVLAGSGLAGACIDLSDGLATDLAHICGESRLGAEVDAAGVPVSRVLRLAGRRLGFSPLDLALRGGEDFEILWTVREERVGAMIAMAADVLGHPPFLVGRMVAGAGVLLKTGRGRRDISFEGYEHRM